MLKKLDKYENLADPHQFAMRIYYIDSSVAGFPAFRTHRFFKSRLCKSEIMRRHVTAFRPEFFLFGASRSWRSNLEAHSSGRLDLLMTGIL